MLSLSFITGTEPDKWFRRFTDRTDHGGLRTVASDDALAQLLSGDVDVALVRLPDARVTDEMHVVRLYDEQPGIALPVDHTLTLLEQVGSFTTRAAVTFPPSGNTWAWWRPAWEWSLLPGRCSNC